MKKSPKKGPKKYFMETDLTCVSIFGLPITRKVRNDHGYQFSRGGILGGRKNRVENSPMEIMLSITCAGCGGQNLSHFVHTYTFGF